MLLTTALPLDPAETLLEMSMTGRRMDFSLPSGV
jgi:hypothetical protein